MIPENESIERSRTSELYRQQEEGSRISNGIQPIPNVVEVQPFERSVVLTAQNIKGNRGNDLIPDAIKREIAGSLHKFEIGGSEALCPMNRRKIRTKEEQMLISCFWTEVINAVSLRLPENQKQCHQLF